MEYPFGLFLAPSLQEWWPDIISEDAFYSIVDLNLFSLRRLGTLMPTPHPPWHPVLFNLISTNDIIWLLTFYRLLKLSFDFKHKYIDCLRESYRMFTCICQNISYTCVMYFHWFRKRISFIFLYVYL